MAVVLDVFGRGLGAALVVGLVVVGSGGCKKEPECARLFDRKKECLEVEGSKADHMRACEELLGESPADREFMKARFDCVKLDGCPAFDDCLQRVARDRRTRIEAGAIEEHLAKNDLRAAFAACATLGKDLREGAPARVCGQAGARIVRELTKGHEDGEPSPAHEVCTSTWIDGAASWFDRRHEIVGLCQQHQHGASIERLISEVEKLREQAETDGELHWPTECASMLEGLETLRPQTPWVTDARAKVGRACYGELALAILQRQFSQTAPKGKQDDVPEACMGLAAVVYNETQAHDDEIPEAQATLDTYRKHCPT